MSFPSGSFELPYYAVIFTSRLARDDGYADMADRMDALAAAQPAYLGIESARGAAGGGITVSYWRDLESIRAWRQHVEHLAAQAEGRARWYEAYQVRVSRVEREYGFSAETENKA